MQATYEGQYNEAGQREGQGKLTLANGSLYEGEFKADEYHGLGRKMDKNGDGFEGEFCSGVMHGEGTMWYASGDVYKGTWQHGLYSGHGVYKEASSGDQYSGEWKQGVREGKGIKTFGDGEFMVSRFAGDVPIGDAAVWSADRTQAWLIKDGRLDDVTEISLKEADNITELIDKHPSRTST
ncbi:radial spoke head 1-like protein [Chrysochromulina tobinii]|uniref:Radial spoke head 1-like protein n=1 Tax=Chrysochromulina tobinii TaxID=1460289 RepID=A0A0M0J5I1_9EUKA|nr:radial spoke head 1-like protein [Chrysochromulina tobinii]|eukprot:KOO21582.1 radial spoke head 1-like protein [Chrysochromulina sp. CCMP291]